MNETKRSTKLQKNEEAMERWLTKLITAANKVNDLRQERKRLLKPPKPSKPPAPKPEVSPSPPPPPSPSVTPVDTTAKDDGDIPTFLRRPLADTIDVDAIAKAMIKDHVEERRKLKARGRIAAKKAKQSGETKRMPLSGKAALARIRAK